MGERVNPMTCDAPNHQNSDDVTYPAWPCDPPVFCFAAQNRSGETCNGFGTFHVLQSHQSIIASTVTGQNSASVMCHAADSVRLLPGFRAGAGSAYFRAEIGACDRTVPGR